MRISVLLCCLAVAAVCLAPGLVEAKTQKFLLKPKVNLNATSTVSVTLEAGGDYLTEEDGETLSQPMNVVGELVYHERFVHWSPDPKEVARSVRRYQRAAAAIKYSDLVLRPELPAEKNPIVAEIRGGYLVLNHLQTPLNRSQLDLLNPSADSLSLDRLLPTKEVAEGENWEHPSEAIAPLLGMDHVAVCEVSSVVIGQSQNQVQIRMAGTVHGTIDGAATEIDLRGAYLFHLKRKRITKFNLAIQEKRSTSEIVPGLESVAQVKVVIRPAARRDKIDTQTVAQASDVAQALPRALLFDGGKLGFQFQHESSWYQIGEQSDLLSFGHLQDGRKTAHCNISTLTARSAGRETTLEEFERDVRSSIGDHLEKVTALRSWTTSAGNACLGVIATGKVNDLGIEWRYYLVSSPDRPRVSVAVTIEEDLVDNFADADRQLIDSLELGTGGPTATAAKRAVKKTK